MNDPDNDTNIALPSAQSIKLDFETALSKRAELQELFPKLNIVLQQIRDTFILEIQVSTPAEREEVLWHTEYQQFAPYITLEAVGVKDTTGRTADWVQSIFDYAR